MLVFHFDPETGVLIGSSEAMKSPLEKDKFLVPANATDIAPPQPLEGSVTVFRNGAWEYEPIPAPEPVPVLSVTDEMIRAEGARRLQLIARPYTQQERETWAQQVLEANAVLADGNAAAPLLALLAAADGVAVSAMAETVLQKAATFSTAAGAILAAQRTLVAMQPIPLDYAEDHRWP